MRAWPSPDGRGGSPPGGSPPRQPQKVVEQDETQARLGSRRGMRARNAARSGPCGPARGCERGGRLAGQAERPACAHRGAVGRHPAQQPLSLRSAPPTANVASVPAAPPAVLAIARGLFCPRHLLHTPLLYPFLNQTPGQQRRRHTNQPRAARKSCLGCVVLRPRNVRVLMMRAASGRAARVVTQDVRGELTDSTQTTSTTVLDY